MINWIINVNLSIYKIIKKHNNYNSLIVNIKVLDYILVTIYLLLIGTSKQIFSSRNI